MKPNTLMSLAIAGMVALSPVVTPVFADPVPFNADPADERLRPFTVDKEEYPFRSHWFERDGVAMHYIDEGEGFPIVLTHGNPDWSFLNRNIIKDMSAEARVIAYDLPGFGFSDTPEGFTWTPQEHAEWITALVNEHLELEEFILVVQDWGGPTGLSVATENADKIAGLVISNTWVWRPEGAMADFSAFMATPDMQTKILEENAFAGALMASGLNPVSQANPAITDAYAMPFPTPESRAGTAYFPVAISEQQEWVAAIEGKLDQFADIPVELIFGELDELLGTEEAIARWRGHFPQAPVQLLPAANHFTQEDSPESFGLSLRRLLSQIEGDND
ncbi:haloalkane dehalogenase [Monaibacterium marinum]|uniref:Haloalkane dehalogenase n=1 Tax=Pontivivens marinum TaxID=1690039 RepID=A0A2C9CW59_9RHOB|nr:alpha/beta fold hydrolase [Monaibacterium marinum]SOH95345.1 haloalkane dehalogenase [Monaibacterium marinum]